MALTIDDAMDSIRGRDMIRLYGWTREQFKRLAQFGSEMDAAIRADRRMSGPRATRLREQLRREFGADQRAVNVLQYEDRTWEREGFQPKPEGSPARQAADAEIFAGLFAGANATH